MNTDNTNVWSCSLSGCHPLVAKQVWLPSLDMEHCRICLSWQQA